MVEKPSDIFYFCSAFEGLDNTAALQKVVAYIETIFPIFFESFVSGPPLNRTYFGIFLTTTSNCDKVVYLKDCINICAIG